MAKSVAAVALVLAGSASAFVGAPLAVSKGASSARSSLVMKLGPQAESLVGASFELGGNTWDPVGFSNNPNAETIAWYRAAELKHGRVAMLASLGFIFQSFFHLPDSVFSESANPLAALDKVYHERPLAVAQIVLAILACEAIGQQQQAKPGQAPGDLGWDPLNLRPDDEEQWEAVQLRELKNGRLAMLAAIGMLYQQFLTGQGPIQQIQEGHLSPFGDGQGFF